METISQADFLAGEGCDEVQGYHFGRPMTPADIDQLIPAELPADPVAALSLRIA